MLTIFLPIQEEFYQSKDRNQKIDSSLQCLMPDFSKNAKVHRDYYDEKRLREYRE